MSKHNDLSPRGQRQLARYRRIADTHGSSAVRENISTLLQEEWGISEIAVEQLLHLARHLKGEPGGGYRMPDGTPIDRTDSMSGWWASTEDATAGGAELINAGLVYRRDGLRNRISWEIEQHAWELLEERFGFDFAESPKHQRAVAVARALLIYDGLEDVQTYTHIDDAKKADVVGHGPREEYQPLPDVEPRLTETRKRPNWCVEVMLDSNNKTHVCDTYAAYAGDSDHKLHWVAEDCRTLVRQVNWWIQEDLLDLKFELPRDLRLDHVRDRLNEGGALIDRVDTVDTLDRRVRTHERREEALRMDVF